MSRYLRFFVCVLLLAGPLAPAAAGQDDLATTARTAALELLQVLPREGSLLLSPFSLAEALAMTGAAVAGETREQLHAVMGFGPDDDAFHARWAELTAASRNVGADNQLSVANALWGQRGMGFADTFLAAVLKYYDGGFRAVDFSAADAREAARQEINAWIAQQTEDHIQDLIQPGNLSSLTRLVLTNAIYFLGVWETPFDPERTETAPFFGADGSSQDVPLMHRQGRVRYGQSDVWEVVELPYAGGDVAMYIFLAADHQQVVPEPAAYDEVRAALQPVTAHIYLPRFTLRQRTVLNEPLQALGMTDAFDPFLADFSPVTKAPNDLYITSVLQEAFMEVDEAGTEAAAATAVIVATRAAVAEEPIVFRADRPFFFAIEHREAGTLLFAGYYAGPGE